MNTTTFEINFGLIRNSATPEALNPLESVLWGLSEEDVDRLETVISALNGGTKPPNQKSYQKSWYLFMAEARKIGTFISDVYNPPLALDNFILPQENPWDWVIPDFKNWCIMEENLKSNTATYYANQISHALSLPVDARKSIPAIDAAWIKFRDFMKSRGYSITHYTESELDPDKMALPLWLTTLAQPNQDMDPALDDLTPEETYAYITVWRLAADAERFHRWSPGTILRQLPSTTWKWVKKSPGVVATGEGISIHNPSKIFLGLPQEYIKSIESYCGGRQGPILPDKRGSLNQGSLFRWWTIYVKGVGKKT